MNKEYDESKQRVNKEKTKSNISD